MKQSPKGPKRPKPNDPAKTEKELRSANVQKGLKIGLPIIGSMVASGVAAITRKSPEAKLDSKGARQEYRSAKKTSKAERIQDKKPLKASRLREKASVLAKKGAANKKAAELIHAAKKK